MTTVAERLREKREAAGYESASDFARAHGFTEPTYRAHENGTRNPGAPALKQYAEALGVDWRWLMLGDDFVELGDQVVTISPEQRGERERKEASRVSSTSISVDELDVRANGGYGLVHDAKESEPVVSRWQMPGDLVRGQTTAPPKSLKIITVYGDSMTPDFLPGERVLVDLDDRRPSPPGVFVLWDGMGLVIKRLELVPGTDPPMVRLIPRNDQYQTYEQPITDMHINGRVIGKWLWT
jgi:phage repressor protein C with HTH and peptisase S24 domain